MIAVLRLLLATTISKRDVVELAKSDQHHGSARGGAEQALVSSIVGGVGIFVRSCGAMNPCLGTGYMSTKEATTPLAELVACWWPRSLLGVSYRRNECLVFRDQSLWVRFAAHLLLLRQVVPKRLHHPTTAIRTSIASAGCAPIGFTNKVINTARKKSALITTATSTAIVLDTTESPLNEMTKRGPAATKAAGHVSS
jgi:hypothetical protein